MIAKTPKPPYFAVIFSSLLQNAGTDYTEMADRILELAKQQPGFLGFETARGELGISVSYWKDEQSIISWRKNSEHLVAQKFGKEKWYKSYKVRVARVDRDYGL